MSVSAMLYGHNLFLRAAVKREARTDDRVLTRGNIAGKSNRDISLGVVSYDAPRRRHRMLTVI